MSTSSLSWFSNAFPGSHEAFGGNIYRLDTAPKYALGFRIGRQDGNAYRYSKFEETGYTRGLICGPDVSANFMLDSDNVLNSGTGGLVTGDGAVGAYGVQMFRGTAATANQFAGGYLITTDDTGEGYPYRIKGNSAGATFRITLYDPLQVAIGTDTDVSIIGCLYNNVRSLVAGTDDVPAGVSISVTTATSMWAFLQTWGVCALLTDGECAPSAAGDMVSLVAASGTAGAGGAWPGNGAIGTQTSAVLGGNTIIGYTLDVGDATGHSVIYLQLAP